MERLKYSLAYFFVVLILASSVHSLEEWSNDADSLTLNVQITGEIETSDPENTKYIQILLDYNPLDDYRQTILSQMHFPDEAYKGLSSEKLLYQFNKIANKNIEYGVSSDIKITNKIVRVNTKENFPINEIPKDAIKYIVPSPTIDSDNEEIIKKSNELAYGEDDLYKLVTKMAAWVSDGVVYDLGVKQFGDSLDASWVLSHKIGVCKEKTNLLIALLRAQGIPARFISGIAYSNLNLTGSPWSAHAWAEVYFPSAGWVPFDPTYQQYGFLDPTHISLKKSLDGTGETISYKWNENGSKVHITPVFISTKVQSESGKIQKRASIAVKTAYSDTEIGSYNLVEADITNNLDSYISPIVVMSNVNGMTILSQNPRMIVLEPGESKKVYFIIKTAASLQQEFKYEIPVVISTTMSDESTAYFNVFSGAESVSYETVERLIPAETKQAMNTTEFFDAVCRPRTDDGVYENSTFHLVCRVINRGGPTQNISVCSVRECKDVKVWKDSFREVGFRLNISSEPQIFPITIKTAKRNYNLRIPVNPIGAPSIQILNLIYPDKVGFADKFTLSFSLNKNGVTAPTNVLTKIKSPYDAQQIKIDSLDQQRDISLTMSAGNLNEGKNTITITTSFPDLQNRTQIQETNISIELSGLSKTERTKLWFHHLLLRMFSFLR